MKTNPTKEEKNKLFHDAKAFKFNLISKMNANNFDPTDIKMAIDYFCFNYSLASIMRKTGVKTHYLWMLIDRVNKQMMFEEKEVVYTDEMTLAGCSFRELYLPVDPEQIQLVFKSKMN